MPAKGLAYSAYFITVEGYTRNAGL